MFHRLYYHNALIFSKRGRSCCCAGVFFPTLTITAFAGLNPYNLAKLVHPGAIAVGIAGSLTAPLFNRIAIEGNYRRVTALTRQAYYNYQNVITTWFYEVANGLNDLNNLRKIYALKL